MYGRFSFVLLAIVFSCQGNGPCYAQENRGKTLGQLIMIGGGLGISNRPVFLDFIEAAGGREKARFVLLPTANLSIESARHFQKELEAFGISENQITVMEVMHTNASLSAKDLTNVDKIDRATAVYMAGGDQVRLVRALTNSDGSDTPLLAAMRRLYHRGGVIAGTSAGASAQSTHMLAASGLPNMLVDEGLDALDFPSLWDKSARWANSFFACESCLMTRPREPL
jgi:cyanophycinase-like exopeptidase